MNTLGLDIGGANLKVADSTGNAASQSFPLWKSPGGLAAALSNLAKQFPPFDHVAVTMTGELCDCFRNKREGVRTILDHVATVFDPRQTHIYTTNGTFVSIAQARERPLQVAAANWHALASFAAKTWVHSGSGLLVDIGSTTTDLIPLADGKSASHGLTDPERLRFGELVYTGARRTPICAVLGTSVAAEVFATMHDAYLYLGEMPQEPESLDTADGRPATRPCARDRLARMLCGDDETVSDQEVGVLAKRACDVQFAALQAALEPVLADVKMAGTRVIVSGSGEFLARKLIESTARLKSATVVSLTQEWGSPLSAAACAYALALAHADRAESVPRRSAPSDIVP